MAWDPSVLFPAAAAAGMLKSITVTLANGSQLPSFDAGFETPDVPFQLQDVKVQSSEYAIEYETAKAPGLAKNSKVLIDGQDYLVREPPSRVGDGFYSKAILTKVKA